MNDARLYIETDSEDGEWLYLEEFACRDDALAAALALSDCDEESKLKFTDFEGFPKAWYSESSFPPDVLWEWLDIDETDKAAFAVYVESVGGTVDDFREAYQGTFDSEADFCENLAEEIGFKIADDFTWIVIDWQATWDCNIRMVYFNERGEDGKLHFFRKN